MENIYNEVESWIYKQTNNKKSHVRLTIPNFTKRVKLEIMPSGRKFFVLYNYNRTTKQNRYIRMGEFPFMPIDVAYNKAVSLSQYSSRSGKFPKKIKKVDEIWNEFLTYQKEVELKKYRTLRTYNFKYTKWIKPILGYKEIYKISEQDLKNLLTYNEKKLGELKQDQTTNYRVYVILKYLFAWAIKQDYITLNPLKNFNYQSEGFLKPDHRNVKHHAKLTNEDEIKNLIEKTCTDDIELELKVCILFGLETSLRNFNILNLSWDEINLQNKTIEIKKEKMKGLKKTERVRENFILPLSNSMVEILQNFKKYRSDNHVFKHIYDRKINTYLKKNFGVTLHGMRGTFKTKMTKLMSKHRVNKEFIEMYMYHSVSNNEIETAYLELSYNDRETQEILKILASYWDNYLLDLYDFKSKILKEIERN